MQLDEYWRELGEFGPFQRRLYFLLSLPLMSVGCFMVMVIIVLYTPEHRCKLPDWDNDTFSIQGESHKFYINQSIPTGQDELYHNCYLYDKKNNASYYANHSAVADLQNCKQWVYDERVFKATFTSQTNLVCDDALKTSHIQMMYYFGVLVGDIAFGSISDMFGRKTALYIGMIGLMGTSIAVTWAPEFYSFGVLQFILGVAVHGTYLPIVVISLEMVEPAMRKWTGMLIQVLFAVGEMYLAFVAYLIRDWQWINLACALPCTFYLAYWWLIPESPRWLISKGKVDESKKILESAARLNKKTIAVRLLDPLVDEKNSSDIKLWHILFSPILLRRTIILMFNWFVVSMTYYGVIMNAGNLAGDFYFNFFLMALAEIPGNLIGLFILDRLGRRYSNGGSMCLGGFACICTIFTVLYGGKDLQPLTVVLAFIGKAGATAAFSIIFIFTAELMPTVVRNSSLGACSCAARVGNMVAPYIAKSGELIGGKFGQVEPLLIFGVLSVIAGIMLLLLPETYGQKLPDTIEEGEELERISKPIIPDEEVEVEA